MIAIFIPTFKRGHKLQAVYDNIVSSTTDAKVYFIVEASDIGSITAIKNIQHKGLEWGMITNKRKNCYAGAINTAYDETTEKYFFCGADDLNFKKGWLELALSKMSDQIKVVGTNDLHNGEVLNGEHATHYLVDRSYIELNSLINDPGSVLPEIYSHNWTDREFIALAQMRGVFAPCLASIVEHLHFGWGLSPKDETYAKQDGTWDSDASIYNERKKLWQK